MQHQLLAAAVQSTHALPPAKVIQEFEVKVRLFRWSAKILSEAKRKLHPQ